LTIAIDQGEEAMKLGEIIGLACALLVSRAAYSFGSDGHMTVGNLADKLIEGTLAADHVKAILGPNEKLREAAIWPDCARGVIQSGDEFKYSPDPKFHDKHCAVFETPDGKEEMKAYVARNWDNCENSGEKKNCHKAFHFADIPLQLGHYSPKSVGAAEHDVVHAITACIVFLRDGSQTEPFHFGEDNQGRREALRLLAHFVGDVHQPLHVGAVYLTANGRAMNPNKTKKFSPKSETRGGNLLFVGHTDNLHHQWDSIATSLAKEDLTGEAAAVLQSDGAIETWSTTWATESIHQARDAYKGQSFGKKKVVGENEGWPVVFKDRQAYLKAQREIQRDQITRAGARLAEVLQAIWPD
jgi:hypothetical protein